MPSTKRRVLRGFVGACVVAAGTFGLWTAFWRSTATGDLHLTRAKLKNPSAQGTDLTIMMYDTQGLGSRHSMEVRVDGRVFGSYDRPPRDGESGMQTFRLEGKIDPARARSLIEGCVKDGALEVHRSREVGVPDEVKITLSIRATIDGVTRERSNWLLSGEVRDEQSFRTTYEALKSVAREIAGER